MAFIRTCFVITVMMVCVLFTKAQTVSYPFQSSQLLKSTAADIAMLLQKAIAGSQFSIGEYSSVPSTGIVFIYDSTITGNQACKVESDGINFIRFSASQDNGLCLGVYQYMQNLGYRFYQPGSAWEIIPTLSLPYKKTDSIYSGQYKYNTWFVSGGHNRWAMDNNNSYGWDVYFGENGHNWALYQRRNGMLGEYRFTGHRSDIIAGSNLATWQNNPCYIASHDNSRAISSRSVPDVQNQSAMQLWSSTIEQKHTSHRNIILGNINLYTNQVRNFNYNYGNIGIEVPDGAQWGNTKDNLGCSNNDYAKESDQHFTLANFTAQKISQLYPRSRFQLYAYSTHADIPSANMPIHEKLDIQLVPVVYQNLTSTNGLRNRWYKRTKNISEYNYLNLSDWSGETPAFYLNDFKATLQIAKDQKSQGLVWEASPAKFASLPYLLAANQNLNAGISVDNTLMEFCNRMFTKAGKTIYDLLQLWTDSKNLAGGISNRYRLPLYFKIVNDAEQEISQEPEIVKERLRELKAYLHYMTLYYEWAGDQSSNITKQAKAAALCLYLAKINRLQLVNSYYLVASITAKYSNNSSFIEKYNYTNGTAYQNGNLPLITAAEIEIDFKNDFAKFSNILGNYKFESVAVITGNFEKAGLIPQKNISVQLNYTNGMDNYNRAEFFIKAPAAGNFTIDYKPSFDTPGKGYINFTVESADKAMQIVEDFSIDQNAKAGVLKITLPSAGNYKLTISSKFKSSSAVEIITNNNLFYKSGAFFGKATEVYQNDIGIPGYFYIPTGTNKVYFSLGNSNPGGTGFATAERINSAFEIRDNNGKPLKARFVTPNDSALFYIDIPEEAKGKFCRFTKKTNYDLVFSNISNYLWYAQPKPQPCNNADFTITNINKNGNCITQVTANAVAGQFEWQVADLGKTFTYGNQRVIELPLNSSPNAMITLLNGPGCQVSKKLKDDEKYLRTIQNCASGAPVSDDSVIPVIYPNPSTGNYKTMKNGVEIMVNRVSVFNNQGVHLIDFSNVRQFNVTLLPAGIYWYKINENGKVFTGKLVKL